MNIVVSYIISSHFSWLSLVGDPTVRTAVHIICVLKMHALYRYGWAHRVYTQWWQYSYYDHHCIALGGKRARCQRVCWEQPIKWQQHTVGYCCVGRCSCSVMPFLVHCRGRKSTMEWDDARKMREQPVEQLPHNTQPDFIIFHDETLVCSACSSCFHST